jgi:hypothetical protein
MKSLVTRYTGIFLLIVGFLLSSICFSAALSPEKIPSMFSSQFNFLLQRIIYGVLSIPSIYIVILGSRLFKLGKRFSAQSQAIDISESDFDFEKTDSNNLHIHKKGEKPFVYKLNKGILYLRSFRDDTDGDENNIFVKTTEEHLSKVLSKQGQLICIGNPKEPLPEPGALRIYYRNRDEGWKNIVTGLLPNIDFVVLRAGTTKGLEWEMRQIKDIIPLEKLICFVQGDVQTRLKIIDNIESIMGFDADTPDERAVLKPKRLPRYGYLIYFDETGKPEVQNIEELGCLMSLIYDTTNIEVPLRFAFRPILKRKGHSVSIPIQWVELIGIILVAAILILLIYIWLFK